MNLEMIEINIALVPSNYRQSNIFIDTSSSLKNKGGLFSLGTDKNIPHITLYTLAQKKDNLHLVISAINSLDLEKRKALWCEACAFSFGRGFSKGYVDIEFHKTHELSDLQSEVVNVLNPIRDGMRKSDSDAISWSEGEILDNLNIYGYIPLGSRFRPHTTLTRFINDVDSKVLSADNISDFSHEFGYVALCVAGENGVCERIIESFEMSTNL